MKSTIKNERVLTLLARAKRLKNRMGYSVQDVRDTLCEEYLSQQNKISVSTVVKWFQDDYDDSIDGESALALQNWIKDYE